MSSAIRVKPADQHKRIHVVQLLSAIAVALLLFSRPGWDQDSLVHEFIEIVGLAFVLACIFGRLWSILYVGGRKNTELVTAGPYSVTRNPLYLFSVIGAIGVGLMFGSILMALLLGTVAYVALIRTAIHEAVYLHDTFGPAYEAYAAATPLFWPNPSLYRDPREVAFVPTALRRTFLDALYFLMLFPLLEGLEYMQTSGYLPSLLHVF
jgi:protein-S-isoprenylcysteine O-methyltransferase Ste14